MWNRKGTKRDESAQKAMCDHRDTIANETRGTARMPDDAMLEALLRAEFDKDAHHTDAAAGCVRIYAADITPFRDFITRIIAGLVLGSITLNFLGLAWILPLVGSILIYSGMRGLRCVNRWMRAAWIFSLVALLYHSIVIFACASPLYAEIAGWNNWAGAGIELALLFCMGKGMQAVNRGSTAGTKQTANPTLPIILWKLAVIALTLLSSRIGQDYMTVLAIAMLVLFILTLRSILKLADAIRDSGYEMEAAPVRVSEKRLWVGLAVFFIVGLMTCNIAFHDTPVDWQEVGLASQTQTQAALPPEAETEATGESDAQQGQAEKNHASAMRALRESLEAKGFRADLLAQIADEDLADLQGCEILNVRVVDYDEAQNGERSSKMQGSIIYVQTAGVEAKAFFLYAYLDTGIRKPHSWIADGASLLSNHEWDGAYGGRVFCERGGKLLTAVPQVEKETIVTPWIGESTMTRAYLKARYSYPLFSRNQRGYLYVWMRDARYAYGMNAEVYACRPGIQLPYRELPPVDRSGALSFGSAPKERILSLYTSYNVFDELAPYVDDVEALFQELGIGTE